MKRYEPIKTGTLLIRAWVETDGMVRARLTQVNDLMSQEQKVVSADSTDEICERVQDWLDKLMQDT